MLTYSAGLRQADAHPCVHVPEIPSKRILPLTQDDAVELVHERGDHLDFLGGLPLVVARNSQLQPVVRDGGRKKGSKG